MRLKRVHSLPNSLMQWHMEITFWQDLSDPVKPDRSSFCFFSLARAKSLGTGQWESWQGSSRCRAGMEGEFAGRKGWQGLLLEELFFKYGSSHTQCCACTGVNFALALALHKKKLQRDCFSLHLVLIWHQGMIFIALLHCNLKKCSDRWCRKH